MTQWFTCIRMKSMQLLVSSIYGINPFCLHFLNFKITCLFYESHCFGKLIMMVQQLRLINKKEQQLDSPIDSDIGLNHSGFMSCSSRKFQRLISIEKVLEKIMPFCLVTMKIYMYRWLTVLDESDSLFKCAKPNKEWYQIIREANCHLPCLWKKKAVVSSHPWKYTLCHNM